ncbi:hypothetical protein [Caballeronia sp. GAWG1-1]|uniref:hypothetical protein n=1 Tax=Caballeronia sp. GAWG1-1 TaxID=2921742 RepID=UPI0020291D12|nr:hypothetical protein [Caballeronia sp. GAWG1-1]
MKSIVVMTALLASTGVHSAVLLGHDLSQPLSSIPDTRSVSSGVADLEPQTRPAWAQGVISLTVQDGRVSQAFIAAPKPVVLPDTGPLDDALIAHTGNTWTYADGSKASYIQRLPESQIGVIAIENIPTAVLVNSLKPQDHPINWTWCVGLFAALVVGGFIRRSMSK